MSGIPPSAHIASSLAQGSLQQSQAARPNDQARNKAAEEARRLKEKTAKKAEAVEDAYEPTDEHVRVEDESGQEPDGGAGGQEQPPAEAPDDHPSLDIQA